jgi:hypothetical protein
MSLASLPLCYRVVLYPRFHRFHDGAEYIIAARALRRARGRRALLGGLSLALTTYSLNLRPGSACAAPQVAWLLMGQSSIFSAITLTLAGHVVASRLSGRSSTSPDCPPSLSARCPLVEDSLLRRQAVRDHMTAVLGREARGTAASGNVPERSVQHRLVHCVVGPGSLSGPCGSRRRSDYVFVSDVEVDEETLGTRGGARWRGAPSR